MNPALHEFISIVQNAGFKPRAGNESMAQPASGLCASGGACEKKSPKTKIVELVQEMDGWSDGALGESSLNNESVLMYIVR